MPVLAKTHLNYFFYIIFTGALVSAILSTVDTTLLASSALFSHNLIFPLAPKLSDKKRVVIARSGTLVSGILSYIIAYSSESITGLVETASSLGGPTILILTIFALWDKKGTSLNALFAMTASLVTWVTAHFMIQIEYPVILTVTICGLSYLVPLPFTKVKVETVEVELS
jgi:Na+/proline symporter